MNPQPKVLACVDQSTHAQAVADAAAWAAIRMDCPLELLHVLDRHPEVGISHDHSGALEPEAQAHLLAQLSEDDARRAVAMRERGRVFLNGLRERLASAHAIRADVRQRHGRLDETLADLQNDTALFAFGRRGESSPEARTAQGALGAQVSAVVRALSRPILTVTGPFVPPQRVLIAYDGHTLNRKRLEALTASGLIGGLPVLLLMAGEARPEAARRELARAETWLSRDEHTNVETRFVPGDPGKVITRAVRDEGIGLMVMGAYPYSPLRSLLAGSRTEELLCASDGPVLLLR